MTCSPRPGAVKVRAILGGVWLALAAGWGTAGAASSGEGRWTVSVRGLDATRAADPVLSGGVLLVDAAALGPSLRLAVRTAGREAGIRDAAGVEWTGATGDVLLAGAGRMLSLAAPLRIEGRSVYLPARTVAELAGLRLNLDPEARTAAFVDAAATSAAAGWQVFTRTKPEALRAAEGQLPHRVRMDLLLPPDHDTLRIGVGLGVVPGADWGSELTATGAVRGIETAVNALLTSGPLGPGLQSGHAVLTDPGRGWGVEAGDLFTEIWGSARGARYRWRRGEDDRASWPAVSLYLDEEYGGREETVLAYRDELRLGRFTVLGGELASDGSWLASGRLRRDRFGLFGYWRETSGRFGGWSTGLSGSAELPAGLSLQAALSRGESGGRALEGRTVSFRLPLRAGSDVTAESARWDGEDVRIRVDTVTAGAAAGRFQLRGRYQRRRSELSLPSSGRLFRSAQDELSASVSWLAGSRLRLEAQLAERRSGPGEPDLWGQLNAFYLLSRHTSLQLFAASSRSGFADAFRVRVDHEIRPGFSCFAEYGDVTTFQPLSAALGEARPRFRIMIVRSWDVATPASGSVVEGVVAGPEAPPMAGVPVELGPYRTVTDAAGRYAFRNVPAGGYEVRLPAEALPASHAPGPPSQIQVQRGRPQRIDLPVVPLGEARGWVYVDRNGNGRRDPGEGSGGVVLVLGGSATRSAADGSFGFFNLPPGAHQLRVEANRLPAGLEAMVPSRMDLGLPAGQSIDHLEFRLQEKKKPVVFQETRR